MKIQLRKPFFPDESVIRIQNKIKDVLHSGQLTLGENVRMLENQFAKFIGTKYAVAVSSATAGLHVSLLSLGIKSGEEVIVPSKTFISTANAALYCNAKPVFCDVDESSCLLDHTKINSLLTKRSRVIIPVHLAGNICNMDEIMYIAKKNNLRIVEDAAHAPGSTLGNRKAGTFGELGVFSFYPDKVISSSDGGMVVTNNKKLYEKLELFRNVGRRKIGLYDYTEIGYNYRMNEIQAILALEQMRILPKMIKRRREIAEIYDGEFDSLKNLRIPIISNEVKSVYYAYIMRLIKGDLVDFRKKLAKRGIETSPMFTTIYKTKAYEKLLGKVGKLCPISEKLDSQTFTIPLHPGMTDNQAYYVIKEIKKIVT